MDWLTSIPWGRCSEESLDIDIAAQVGVQTFAAVSTAIYSAVATWVILKAVDATVGLRAPAGAEAAGMDQYSFGEDAYVEEG